MYFYSDIEEILFWVMMIVLFGLMVLVSPIIYEQATSDYVYPYSGFSPECPTPGE